MRCLVELGRGLGMGVVAEGVEDAATYAQLVALGCDLVQGWYVSRALPGPDLVAWLADHPTSGLPDAAGVLSAR